MLICFFSSRFNIQSFTDAQIRSRFRFHSAADIIRLVAALGLPAEIRLDNGSVIDGVTALCVTLRRLAYPCRLEDLEPTFGRNREVLSLTVKKPWSWFTSATSPSCMILIIPGCRYCRHLAVSLVSIYKKMLFIEAIRLSRKMWHSCMSYSFLF